MYILTRINGFGSIVTCVLLNVKKKGKELSDLIRRLKFSLRVLYISLQLPLEIIVIVLFSAATIYITPIVFMSFVYWNLDFVDIRLWNNGARAVYVILVILLSLAIFGRRKRYFK